MIRISGAAKRLMVGRALRSSEAPDRRLGAERLRGSGTRAFRAVASPKDAGLHR
ncbi:hypothetical protein ACFFUA_34585 [Streptomyces heliomycini]|uniref:Uncharacterized protein n=1 Tax=Streptomyces heliomycini TaxID=284032 RepID=A0ABV5LJZ3_9ACTN